MSSTTASVIARAVAETAQRWDIPSNAITTDVVDRFNGEEYVRTLILLPDHNGTRLVVTDDDNVAVILRLDRRGSIIDEVRVLNPRLPILQANLDVFVAEAAAELAAEDVPDRPSQSVS